MPSFQGVGGVVAVAGKTLIFPIGRVEKVFLGPSKNIAFNPFRRAPAPTEGRADARREGLGEVLDLRFSLSPQGEGRRPGVGLN